MTAKFINLTKGRCIAYNQSTGQSPGIVFLGGYSSDMNGTKSTHMDQWAQMKGISYLRFDYTGHGQSSGQFVDGCISDWFEDALDVIDSLTSGPQLLIGSSMGGWIALLLARIQPEKIAGIVGIAAAPDFTQDFEENRLSKEELGEVRKQGLVRIPTEYSDEGLVVTQKLLQDGHRNFVLNQKLDLPFPVRFLQGTEDKDVDYSVAVNLLNHCSGQNIRLLIVKGANHSFSSPDCLSIIENAVEDILGDLVL